MIGKIFGIPLSLILIVLFIVVVLGLGEVKLYMQNQRIIQAVNNIDFMLVSQKEAEVVPATPEAVVMPTVSPTATPKVRVQTGSTSSTLDSTVKE